MRELNINPNWNFKELVGKLKALRSEYDGILCLFKCYEVKERIKYRQEIRDKIYNLNIEYWQKDRIWDYMNHDEIYKVLKEIASRYK